MKLGTAIAEIMKREGIEVLVTDVGDRHVSGPTLIGDGPGDFFEGFASPRDQADTAAPRRQLEAEGAGKAAELEAAKAAMDGELAGAKVR